MNSKLDQNKHLKKKWKKPFLIVWKLKIPTSMLVIENLN